MKINEIIAEGVWDNLKTAGQTIKQGAGTMGQGIKQGANAVGQGVKQGVGAVANKVGQGVGTAYNTAVQPQARQQRFDQQAAQQYPGSKTGALGKEYSPQAQLRYKNAGTFMGDVAKTINQASGAQSYFTQATNKSTENPTPPGSKVKLNGNKGSSGAVYNGEYVMSNQGWVDNTTKQPVRDAKIIADLNDFWFDRTKADQQQQRVSPGGLLGPDGKPIRYDEKGNPVIAQ
jgi:hypothetical protein